MPKEKFPASVIVYVHPKGWMDTDGMLIWSQKVWGRRPGGGVINTKSLLFWDQFRAHLNNKVKQRTAHSYTRRLCPITQTSTSYKPVSTTQISPSSQGGWHKFSSRLICPSTIHLSVNFVSCGQPGCRLALSNEQQLATWSGHHYQSSHSGWKRPGILPTPAIISKSFKKCSISNDLDGTEDDELWDEHHNKSDTDKETDKMYDDMLTHEQIQQMFNEDSDDDKFLGFE